MSSERTFRSMQEVHEAFFPGTLFVGDRVRDTFSGRVGRIKHIVGRIAVVESCGPAFGDWWTADIPLSSLERVST